jgi:hypothetical protein
VPIKPQRSGQSTTRLNHDRSLKKSARLTCLRRLSLSGRAPAISWYADSAAVSGLDSGVVEGF